MKKNSQTEHRLTFLETSWKEIQSDIHEIKNRLDNHINKIYDKIDRIEDVLNKRPGWLITGLVSLLIALIAFILGKFL